MYNQATHRVVTIAADGRSKHMIRQLLIIFGCLAVGEIVVRLTGIAIPSSIIGMLLLTALLQMKVVKLEWVKGVADFLIANI